MARRERIICVVSSSIATFISAWFVLGYNGIKYHNHVEHEGLALPLGLHWIGVAAPWMLLVPLLAIVLGLLCLKRPWAVTVITAAAWLFTVGWALVCIYAWELPFVIL